MPEFNDLIPELSEWNDGKGIDVHAWLAGVGSYEHAIAYGALFWPEFVEHSGCVFLARGFSRSSYRSWMSTTSRDKTATEKVMNHVHVCDLFVNSERTSAQSKHIAGLLKECWECKLRRDFPNRTFIVDVYDCESVDPDWSDCQVTFYQPR